MLCAYVFVPWGPIEAFASPSKGMDTLGNLHEGCDYLPIYLPVGR